MTQSSFCRSQKRGLSPCVGCIPSNKWINWRCQAALERSDSAVSAISERTLPTYPCRRPALAGSLFVRHNREERRGFTYLPFLRSHGFYFYTTISPLVIFNRLADKRLGEVWVLLAGSEERWEGREEAVPAVGALICTIQPIVLASAHPILPIP